MPSDDSPPIAAPTAPPPLEPTPIPIDTVVTLAVENNEIPVLVSHIIQDTNALDHPSVTLVNPVPDLEYDEELEMVISLQPGQAVESDPNCLKTNQHLLLPLAQRAAQLDNNGLVRLF